MVGEVAPIRGVERHQRNPVPTAARGDSDMVLRPWPPRSLAWPVSSPRRWRSGVVGEGPFGLGLRPFEPNGLAVCPCTTPRTSIATRAGTIAPVRGPPPAGARFRYLSCWLGSLGRRSAR